MTPHRGLLTLAFLPFALVGCSFSASVGGLDYDKLEGEITKTLNESYASMSREVSTVDCPKLEKTPKTGDTFMCTADLDGNPVRVQVKVADDENNVNYETLDTAYDLPTVAAGLTTEVSNQVGFPVTVTCGDGVEIVAVGSSFECTATDENGETRTVKVTAAAVGADDHWELV